MPFVALLVAGAMASLDRGTIEAARNLGASRLRILIEIVVPQIATTLLVGLILSFVTMMSVLSVPLMINAQSPTMLTADIAFRINAYGDYGVANALGLVSLVITSAVHRLSAPNDEGARMSIAAISIRHKLRSTCGGCHGRQSWACLPSSSSVRCSTCCCGRSPNAGIFPTSCRSTTASASGLACSRHAAMPWIR